MASIILVNLLVAMFSDTYNRILENAEVEYKFQKYNRIFLYTNIVTSIPPPFNLPIVINDLASNFLCGPSSATVKPVAANDTNGAASPPTPPSRAHRVTKEGGESGGTDDENDGKGDGRHEALISLDLPRSPSTPPRSPSISPQYPPISLRACR